MDPVWLANQLAERIQEVVPDGIRVWAEGDMLKLNTSTSGVLWRSASYAMQALTLGQGETQEQRTIEACWRALDDEQDFLCESTTDPWPGTTTMPPPGALIESDEILLWYGSPEDPMLRLRPIPLPGPLDR